MKFIATDEEGYLAQDGARIEDEDFGGNLLRNIQYKERSFATTYNDEHILVEAFDSPFVAREIQHFEGNTWRLKLPYGVEVKTNIETFCLDEWDRFHGITDTNLPFVLNRNAQMEFFNSLESFDDDSITMCGQTWQIPTYNTVQKYSLKDRMDISSSPFWSEYYKIWSETDEPPKWHHNEPTPTLISAIAQIKMPKARICVLGSGTGEDAAYLASLGHLVTAVDISPEAVDKARAKHGESSHLKFVCSDVFEWAKSNVDQFDLVYEHTFFCAIDPDRRAELVQHWRRLLVENGHLLGIFFAFEKLGGPPFSATEWEIRQRLKKSFQSLYWTRWRKTPNHHLGIELVVYARKV